MLLPFAAYAAETRIGISAALSNFESSGTETLKSSSNKTNKTVENTILPKVIEVGGAATGY